MSLIFGIIDQDIMALPAALQQLYDGVAHLPHERHSTTVEGTAGFGQLLSYDTPEALFERQPTYLPDQQLLITSEARLDNRPYLARQLGIRLQPELPDGKLIEAAYLRWGHDTPLHLRGDWSFAVYDYRDQELFVARDHHGYTAVYYHHDDRRFTFASSAKSIFALAGFQKRINMRHFLGGLLQWKPTDPGMLAFESIHLIPPAHTLRFRAGKLSLSRYWFPEHTPARRYKNPDDYAEELREIFSEAVRVRLRSHKPVASMLSGGLDSGSVSAMAAHLLKQAGKQLTTFSHVPHHKEALAHESSRKLLDETPHILATAAHAGNIHPILLSSPHISPITGFIRAMAHFDSHFHAACNAFWLVDLPEQAAQQGFGTLLSGEMGNATISFAGVDYQLPWRHPAFSGRPVKLAKNISKSLLMKYHPSYFGRQRAHRDYIKHNYARAEVLDHWRVLEDFEARGNEFHQYYTNAKAGMLHILDVGRNPRCQFGGTKNNAFGLDYRDPTGDVNVIEYCLSIPSSAFFDQELNNKHVLKRMMQGYLPTEVLHAKRKGLQASDTKYRLLAHRQEVDDLLANFSACGRTSAIMDIEKLKDEWRKTQDPRFDAPIHFYQHLTKGLMYSHFIYCNQ